MKRELTGYPSIDKPWEQNYVNNNSDGSNVSKTVYQMILDNNKEYLDGNAIQFFDRSIDYSALFKKISSVSKSLEEYGVKKGDFVTVCLTTIPETAFCFYAISKIGAIANMISPFFNHDDLIKRIAECESDTLIIMDKFYDIFKETIRKSRIKNVIVVPTMTSSLMRPFFRTSAIEARFGDVFWKTFLEDGSKKGETKTVPYEKNSPLAMVYSSGTTGASKGILLSNDSFQRSVVSYLDSGVDIQRGTKFYQTIPPWYSTGLSTSLHLPLSYGSTVLMDPRYNREIFVKNIYSKKPNYVLATTSMYEGFLEQYSHKKGDLSFLTYPFEGGEPLSVDVANRINDFFQSQNCSAKLKQGYGQCECGATITSQTNQIEQSGGSVGIPLPGVIIKIVDEEFKELPYYSRGKIVVSTPCRMMEYYKKPEETSKCFHVDENGVTWNQTDDIGYIDETGNLYVLGRESDYSEINSKKVYNFDIENIILSIEGVKTCEVIGREDEDGNNMLVAHIIFEKEYERENLCTESQLLEKLFQITTSIKEIMHDDDFVPHVFKVRETFPFSQSGKRDVKAISSETDDFIYLDLNNRKKLLI